MKEVEGLNDVVVVIDLECNVLYWNRAGEDLLEWKADEVLGRKISDIFPVWEEILPSVLETDKVNEEITIAKKSGEEFIADLSVSTLQDGDENPFAFLVIIKDISSRREIEKQLRKLKERGILLDIATAISSSTNVEEVAFHFLERSLEITDFDRATFNLFEKGESGRLEILWIVSVYEPKTGSVQFVGHRIEPGPGFPITKMLLQEMKTLLFPDAPNHPALKETRVEGALRQTRMNYVMDIPMIVSDRLIGVVTFERKENRAFSASEINSYETSVSQSAMMIDNLRLFAETQKQLQELTELRGSLEQQVMERTREVRIFQQFAENSLDGIIMGEQKDEDKVIINYVNPVCYELYGYSAEEIIGKNIALLWFEEDEPILEQEILSGISRGSGWDGEMKQKRKDRSPFDAQMTFFEIEDESGGRVWAAIVRDITMRKRLEMEREGLYREIVEAQRRVIRELSTPIIPVADNIIVMPLVGTIDTARSQQIMESLLQGIKQYKARIVIIDITGVPMVDTGVADHLLQSAKAASLLGSQVVLAGISPEVAQTIVHLGVDLTDIATKSDLQSGIEYALGKMGRYIGTRKDGSGKL